MSHRYGVVECPRCHKIWRLQWASPGVECTCHLICSDGDTPNDCNFTSGGGQYPYNYSGQLGWPVGAHLKSENEGDDVLHRTGYCSTHSKFTYREPIWLEVDWKRFEKERLPRKLRKLKTA